MDIDHGPGDSYILHLFLSDVNNSCVLILWVDAILTLQI